MIEDKIEEFTNETYIDPNLTQQLISQVATHFGWSVTQAGLALIAIAGGSLAGIIAIFREGGLQEIIHRIKQRHESGGSK